MPRNTNGSFAPPTNSASPAAPLTPISSADFNTLIGDIVGALADSLSRSGKGGMQAALDMGGFAINNLGDPTGPSSPARLSDVTALQGTLKALAFKDNVSNADWSGADLSIENGGTGASTAASARSNLGLGTAATSDAAAFATAAQGALAASAVQPSRMVATGAGLTGGGTLGQDRTLALTQASQDSLALANTAVQPSSLGALAAKNTVNDADWSGADLSIANGGTGASTAAAARAALNALGVGDFGLGGVAASPGSDLDTIMATGVYAADGTQANRPQGNTGNWLVLHMARLSNLHAQLAINRTNGAASLRFRNGDNWNAWIDLYTAQNLARPSQAEAQAGTATTARAWDSLRVRENVTAYAAPLARGVPPGGLTGQYLAKSSNADFATTWSSAGAGDMLKSENLSGLADNSAARSNIGLPPATDALIDAGTDTSTRAFSVANLWRSSRAERGLISRATYSGAAQISVTGLASYRRLRLSGRMSPSSSGRLYLQLSTDNGASWLQTNVWQILASSGTTVAGVSGVTIFFPFSGDSNVPVDSNQAVTFEMSIDLTPSQYPRIIGHGSIAVSATEHNHMVSGRIDLPSGTVNALRVLPAAGTLFGLLNVEGIRT